MKYLLIVAMLFVVGCGSTDFTFEDVKKTILSTPAYKNCKGTEYNIHDIKETEAYSKCMTDDELSTTTFISEIYEDTLLTAPHPEDSFTFHSNSETLLTIGYDGTIDWRGDKGKAIDGFWDAIQTSGMNLYQNGWDAAMKECKGAK